MRMFSFLTKLLCSSDHHAESFRNEVRPSDELWEAIDLVVKLSHPNIHYVSGYRKKLMPAVEHTLKYADELISHLPTPIHIRADSYNTDPFVQIIFLNADQFRIFFSENKQLKEFFQKTDAHRCCALMVMNREEKKAFGVEMDGNIMKRDVLRTSVNFSDHQIVAPMISEDEVRKELSLRTLALLATHSMEDILSLIEWKKEMETEKHIIELKLHLQNASVRHRTSLLPDISDNTYGKNEVSVLLEQLDKKIAEVRAELDEPEDYLKKVADLLYQPERFLKSEFISMIVNDMNIIVEKEHQEKGHEIRFAELTTGTGLRKAAVLIDCDRQLISL